MSQDQQPIKTAAIYKITVKRDGKDDRYYIGQATDFHTRKVHHLWSLKNGRHKNKILQSAYDFYGADAFHFEILAQCDKDRYSMAAIEKQCLDCQIEQTGIDSVYNILIDSVISRAGVPHSEETKAKMSEVAKKNGQSDAQKASWIKVLKSKIGKKLSPESIAKRTAKQTGIKRTEETKNKMSQAMKGKTLSEEVKKKISQTKKAQKKTMSQEHKNRLREINKDRKMPEELRLRLIQMKLGTKKSPEEIARRQATRAANKLKKLEQLKVGT